MIKHVDSGGQVKLVTNVRRPRKWRRYEYLLSSGTLWIDTGIKTSINTKFAITIRLTYPTTDLKFVGAYLPGGVICTLDNKWRILSNTSFHLTDIATNSDKVNIEFYGNTFKVNSFSYTLGTSIAASDVNIFLFLADYQGNPAGGLCAIYEYKHYEGDLLVRHMVPAQYNGEYGMWDLVEDKFYKNAGTGSFTVGPEMKNYDEITEIKKSTSILPAGVELYDYILSNGTSTYLDTGINPLVKPRVVADLTFVNSTDADYWGNLALNGSAYYADFYQYSLKYYRFGSTAIIDCGNTVSVNTRHIYDVSDKVYLDGTLIKTTANTYTYNSSQSTILIFKAARGSLYSNYKLHNFKLYDGDTLVRHLLPCTYLGEPGMWDTVENKFYRNQGTGQFILGNKIILKEYEYLQSSGALYTDANFIPDYQTTLEVDYLVIGTGYYWGAGRGEQNNGINAYLGSYVNANKQINIEYLGLSYGYINNVGLTLRTKYKSQIIENKYYVSNNNEQIIIDTINTSKICTGSFIIFGVNNGSPLTPSTGSSFKLYNFKLYSNSTLIRDFIPVSYNGTPGLWDKVEWKFYANVGSGSFTLGPEKSSGICLIHDLNNLFNGFQGGGGMTLVDRVLYGTGENKDTYFAITAKETLNTTSKYLVGVYVLGYNSATSWVFLSPYGNTKATLYIGRDGWNWGVMQFTTASSRQLFDDDGRPPEIPKLIISDCKIYKLPS